MKTPEEILCETTDYDAVELLERKCSPILQPNDCLKAMEEYGKQQWNKAIRAAAKNAKCLIVYKPITSTTTSKPDIFDCSVDKDSILKLLKK